MSSMFGGASNSPSSRNDEGVSVSSQGAMVSPYLNFDPSYLGASEESQFIFPEGANPRRGRFELAFSQIGGSVFLGGFAGGVNGFYTGLRETSGAQLTGAVRRTQVLNYITKQGASSAQSLGVIALMYSGFGVLLSQARGVDDELNTMTAATATGLLFKSSAGWRRCGVGGAVGFSIAAVYCAFTSRDRVRDVFK